MTVLLDLPEELLIKILIYLPPQDLLLTKLLSRTFYSLITYSTALVYQIECFRYGVADVNSSSAALPSFPDRNRRRSGFDGVGTIEVERITVAEKLERLREREKGWDRLDGSSKEAGRRWTQFTAGESPIYELQSGLFIRGTNFTLDLGSDPTPPSSGRPTALEIFTLPSAASKDTDGASPMKDKEGEDAWHNEKVDVETGEEGGSASTSTSSPLPTNGCPSRVIELGIGPILDFGIDPTQNLIVALTRPSDRPLRAPPDLSAISARAVARSRSIDPTSDPAHPQHDPSPAAMEASILAYFDELDAAGYHHQDNRRSEPAKGYVLHLLDLQGRPRKDLCRYTLDVVVDEWDENNSWLARCCIQICEDTLAVFLVNFTGEEETELLTCFNWRASGTTCVHVYPPTITTRSFALLSPTTYALTDFDLFNRAPRINTYSFNDFPNIRRTSPAPSSSPSPASSPTLPASTTLPALPLSAPSSRSSSPVSTSPPPTSFATSPLSFFPTYFSTSDDEDDGEDEDDEDDESSSPDSTFEREQRERAWRLQPRLMASYQFPSILPQPLRETTFNFELRPDPPSSRSGFVFDGSNFPFQSSGEDAEAGKDGGNGGRQRSFSPNWECGVLALELIVDRRVFQGYLLKEMLFEDARIWKEEDESTQAVVRPWVSWGVDGCRLIEDLSGSRHWVTFVVGHRAIAQVGSLSPLQQLALYARGATPPPPRIAVLDFNPHTLGHQNNNQPAPFIPNPPQPFAEQIHDPVLHSGPVPGSYPPLHIHSQTSTSPPSPPSSTTSSFTSTIPAQTTFGQDIVTQLPYRVQTLSGLPPGGTEGCKGVMLDEERIILTFKARADSDWIFKVLPF